jgi:organic hydroperoxide reductase OsmC/OhrA
MIRRFSTPPRRLRKGVRGGRIRTPDGRLDLELDVQEELGGRGGASTNPEELFAAGYAACFQSVLLRLAAQQQLAIPRARLTARIGTSDSSSRICWSRGWPECRTRTREKRRFCSALKASSSVGCWKTKPIERRTAPRRHTTSKPLTSARPPVGRSSVESMLMVVVLPAPFGPSNPKTSPSSTWEADALHCLDAVESACQLVDLDHRPRRTLRAIRRECSLLSRARAT